MCSSDLDVLGDGNVRVEFAPLDLLHQCRRSDGFRDRADANGRLTRVDCRARLPVGDAVPLRECCVSIDDGDCRSRNVVVIECFGDQSVERRLDGRLGWGSRGRWRVSVGRRRLSLAAATQLAPTPARKRRREQACRMLPAWRPGEKIVQVSNSRDVRSAYRRQ